jgi:serine phosphatase RsbU (regulator of sigma subunit)
MTVLFLWYLYTRFQLIRKQKEQISTQKQELEKVYNALEEHHKEIQDSIVYAKRIQDIILPDKEMLNHHLKSGFILFRPKDVVSGDFYWMEVSGNNVFYAAADCTGHGVPGAMVSVVCSNALTKALVEEKIDSPAEILNRARELVIQRFSKNNKTVRDGMDISLCKYNKETYELEWAGANNPVWIFRNNQTVLTDNGKKVLPKMEWNGVYGYEIKGDSQPIGYYETAKPFSAHKFSLQKGDKIYIFSDGYIDQFGGPKGKKFKSKNLFKLLLNNYDISMDEQKELLEETIEKWMKESLYQQIDDICVFGVEIV